MSTILHLGVGAFHRAHQAAYMQRLRQSGERRWRLVGGNIRDDAEPAIHALAAAGCRYTLETISPAGEHRYERIESIDQVIPWSADLGNVIAIGARADTRIVADMIPCLIARGRPTMLDLPSYRDEVLLRFLERWHRGELPFTHLVRSLDAAAAHAIRRAGGYLLSFATNHFTSSIS